MVESGLGTLQLRAAQLPISLCVELRVTQTQRYIYPTLAGAGHSGANFVNSGDSQSFAMHDLFSLKHIFSYSDVLNTVMVQCTQG